MPWGFDFFCRDMYAKYCEECYNFGVVEVSYENYIELNNEFLIDKYERLLFASQTE